MVEKEIKRGKSPKYADRGTVFVFAQKCNVKQGGIDMSLAKYLDMKTFDKYPSEEYMRDGDIIINSTGNGTLGRIGMFHDSDRINDNIIVPDSHVTLIRVIGLMQREYLFHVLKYYQPFLEDQGEGSTNQTELRPATVAELFIPVPPFAEQIRITEKLIELLPLVEVYGIKAKSLDTYNKDFPVQLKKSILQMAVQGKLVPQDPADEPASVLLERIRVEKQRLIAEGKIKRDKHESVIFRRDNSHYEKLDGIERCIDDEIPFDIPETWEWVRLGSVVDMLSGFAFKSTDFRKNGRYRLLRGINLGVGNIRWDDAVFVDEIPEKLQQYQILKDDVLIGLDRPWISGGIRVAIFDESEKTYLVQRVLRIRKTCAIIEEYIAFILRSNLFQNAVEAQTTGISVPHISPSQVGNVAIPLPPIAEQSRIVAQMKLALKTVTTM